MLKHPNSSFVWQQLGLLPWKTVEKNLTLPLLLSQHKIPAADCAHRAAAMIEELGLSGLENRWPATLSGGQRQRLALGRALIAQPAVLFMDEPFSALDALRRERLQDFLAGMRRRRPTTMIFVTHDIGEAAFLASDILLLGAGPLETARALRQPGLALFRTMRRPRFARVCRICIPHSQCAAAVRRAQRRVL